MLRGVAATLVCTVAAVALARSMPAAPELQWLLVMWVVGPVTAGILVAAMRNVPSLRRRRAAAAIAVIAHALVVGVTIGKLWSNVVTHQACPGFDGCGLATSADRAPRTMVAWSTAFAVLLVALALVPGVRPNTKLRDQLARPDAPGSSNGATRRR